MRELLALVWGRSDVEPATFDGDEFADIRGGEIDRLSRAGLVCPVVNVRCVPCDACSEHHLEEVTYIQSPPGSPIRAYINCPENGRIAVPLERLKQWAVDFEGLAKATASGLDLAGQIEDIIPGRLWSLGKATIGRRSRDIFLARGATWFDAPDVFGACQRLNASRGALMFVPGDMPSQGSWIGDPPAVVHLKLVANLEGEHLVFDRDHLESLLTEDRRKAPIKAQESFPTPPGTQWADVMAWVTDSSITIEAKRLNRTFSFQAAGFEEKRKGGVPDASWALLKVFAMNGGVIPYDGTGLEHKVRTNLKQYVAELRKRLQALIPGVDGNPIPYDRGERCYRMAFRIATQDGVKFPVPSGTEWPHVTITLVGTDTIRITVPSTERFAASAYAEESGSDVHQWDAAERESELERGYDLRILGLTDEDGRPDARGQALIDVLRADGALTRPADDDAMLDLCGVLTKLMDGIDSSPFDFASGSQTWVALFEVSCEPQ